MLSVSESEIRRALTAMEGSNEPAAKKDSLNRIFTQLRPLLFRMFQRRIGQKLQSKGCESDIVQQALLNASEELHTFRGRSANEMYAWARAILNSQLMDFQRRYLGVSKRDVTREQPICENALNLTRPRLDAGSGTSLEKLVKAEDALHVRTCVAQLPAHYREVVELRHINDLTFPEIAARLSRSEQAVKNYYVRALKILKRKLAPSSNSLSH